jgi:ABC-type proline/glycine betaine transport system ATPase subunit
MSEVGAILTVGGNIAGYTRVMTTTIALETDKGNFELAMVLWIILLIISFLINIFLFSIQKKSKRVHPVALSLIISNITKSYNGKIVLDGCSFSFEKSGVCVLMGPNGSGKSALLRICALLETPDNGEVVYYEDGKVVENNLNLRRRITLLLPNIGIFNTKVFKNVAYGLTIRGMNKRETKKTS